MKMLLMLASAALFTACGSTGNVASPTVSSSTPQTSIASPSPSPRDAAAAIAVLAAAATQNPGLQVYLRDGTTETSLAYGKAAYAPDRSMTPDDTLMVASVTKPIVAAATMALVAKGVLSLDDPIEKWLGPAVRPGGAITIEQLLSMTSGLPEYGAVPQWKGPGKQSSLSLLRMVKATPLQFAPGTSGAYTNTNYAALGAILEKATGNPLARVLRTTVFGPARMTESHLGGKPSARSYNDRADVTPEPERYPSAAAGVISSARDLGRFLTALSDGTLVSHEALREMTRQRSTMDDGGYGLGLVLYSVPCGTAIGHYGINEAYAAGAFLLPSTGRVVAVTANSGANDDLQNIVKLSLCS